MKAKMVQLTVNMEKPEDVTTPQLMYAVVGAIRCIPGHLDPTNPLFLLDRTKVTVFEATTATSPYLNQPLRTQEEVKGDKR